MNGGASAAKVIVVGAGGNIGSHLVPHLGRSPAVAQVVLVDRDCYELSNLESQDITRADAGKHKAVVQARRLRRINPSLEVVAVADSIENVPLGRLRSNVILSCLDSRVARQRVNQYAWRLGVPVIDAGVEAGGLLARVNVYVPGQDSPCLECAWDDRDYAALEQTYACAGIVTAGVAPTNAPSSLGALAASLQAIECRKLLVGEGDRLAAGKQVLIDAAHHRHFLTAFRRNPACRFDHAVWEVEELDAAADRLSLRAVFEAYGGASDGHGSVGLAVEGKYFASKLTCRSCGASKNLLRLDCSLSSRQRACPACGQRMSAAGFDLIERIGVASLSPRQLESALSTFGLRRGDVISIGAAGRERHCLIGDYLESKGDRR